jgi:hypothetical protein
MGEGEEPVASFLQAVGDGTVFETPLADEGLAARFDQLRVIDESGDDYLYPKGFFRSIALPDSIKKEVLAAA